MQSIDVLGLRGKESKEELEELALAER